jgi:hypothetical protein
VYSRVTVRKLSESFSAQARAIRATGVVQTISWPGSEPPTSPREAGFPFSSVRRFSMSSQAADDGFRAVSWMRPRPSGPTPNRTRNVEPSAS